MILIVVPPARDGEEVLDWLVRLGAGTPYDARQRLLRGAPFMLAGTETAAEWAGHLTEAGLWTVVIDDDAPAHAPPVVDVRAFVFSPEGLSVTCANNDVHLIDAQQVQAVIRARRDDGKRTECFYVLCAAPDLLLRFSLGAVDTTGLGERMTSVVRTNHLLLQTIVENSAPNAWKDARLDALSGKLPPLPKAPSANRLVLAGVEGPFEEAVVLLCLALRAPSAGATRQ